MKMCDWNMRGRDLSLILCFSSLVLSTSMMWDLGEFFFFFFFSLSNYRTLKCIHTCISEATLDDSWTLQMLFWGLFYVLETVLWVLASTETVVLHVRVLSRLFLPTIHKRSLWASNTCKDCLEQLQQALEASDQSFFLVSYFSFGKNPTKTEPRIYPCSPIHPATN